MNYIGERERGEKKENSKQKKKKNNFPSSDGIARLKLSLERPYFVPQWHGLEKRELL